MGWITTAFAGSKTARDDDGQPVNRFYRAQAVEARQLDEMIGLIRGVLADGALRQEEVEFLLRWIESNRVVMDQWPASAIYPRIVAALADDVVDADEESELMQLLLSTVGDKSKPAVPSVHASTTLPLTEPVPAIVFPERSFCFTGKFNSGTRQWCEEQVQSRGGIAQPNVTHKLNYLVIGDVGSRDWLHSTFGNKIKKALEQREKGIETFVVSEQSWYGCLAQ